MIRRAIVALAAASLLATAQADTPAWTQSYDAGYVDANGAYAGGSEIMHLVSHRGKLYAANGYWMDRHWVIPPDTEKQSAQVLRLDEPAAQWQVDLDAGRANDGLGLNYMKGNILKSVTFTQGPDGHALPQPAQRLIFAAGSVIERGGAVSAWVRNDSDGSWHHELVRHGSNAGGVRWVPRDMEVYTDKVTGQELLLLSLGNPGIISGQFDPSVPGDIRWSRHLEYPFPEQGTFFTRPLGMVEANGRMLISEGESIYQRVDGERPHYEKIFDLKEDADTDIGGIRGLTVIEHPHGPGQSVLFLWAPSQGSQSQIKRMDPDGQGGYTVHDEARLADLLSEAFGVEVPYTLGAHNAMYPVVHPETGETVHLIGFQSNFRGKNLLQWKPSSLYAGAVYAMRHADQTYRLLEVNNAYHLGKAPLITPRAICRSPFGDDALYFGGHDASRRISDDMAWVMRAPIPVALGIVPGATAPPARAPTAPEPRLLGGPIYELRIYQAAERRHEHLIKRFRDHTDRLFKKHHMQAIGYWIPTEGTYKQKRRFVYILKHASRYAAYQNWNAFSIDREWERIIDQPEFKGVLSEKPISIFMNAIEEGATRPSERCALRIHTATPAERDAVEAKLLASEPLGLWRAFDRPESETSLIELTDAKSEYRQMPGVSTEEISLRALGFSPKP